MHLQAFPLDHWGLATWGYKFIKGSTRLFCVLCLLHVGPALVRHSCGNSCLIWEHLGTDLEWGLFLAYPSMLFFSFCLLRGRRPLAMHLPVCNCSVPAVKFPTVSGGCESGSRASVVKSPFGLWVQPPCCYQTPPCSIILGDRIMGPLSSHIQGLELPFHHSSIGEPFPFVLWGGSTRIRSGSSF